MTVRLVHCVWIEGYRTDVHDNQQQNTGDPEVGILDKT
jgi:hypothetical protein